MKKVLGTGPAAWRAILLMLVLVPLLVPLYRQYWIQNHEGYSYALRVKEVLRCWHDGAFSSRWFPDLYYGQGYPFLCFYAPLSIVTPAALAWAGADVLLALKLAMTLATVLAALGAYRLARRGLSPSSAFVASVLYTLAPYHVSNLYVRGDIAEYFAMGFLPWGVEAVLALRERRSPRHVAAVGVFGAGAILSHNLLGLFTGGAMALTGLVAVATSRERLRTGLLAAAGGALALGLSAFFWIPALAEQPWVKTFKMLDAEYAVTANFQPLASLLGLGERPATEAGMPVLLGLGWAAVPLIVVAVVFVRRLARETRPLLAVAAILLIGGAFLTHRASRAIYEHVPLLQFTQFPWRFYALVSLGAALAAAFGFELLSGRLRPVLRVTGAALVSVAAYAAAWGAIAPAPSLPFFPDLLSFERMRAVFTTTTGRNEYMPRWVTKAGAPVGFVDGVKVQGDAAVREVVRRVGRYDFGVDANGPSVIRLQDVYYPVWNVTLNGRRVEARAAAGDGHVEIDVPAGTWRVQARLVLTRLRAATAILSGALAMATIGLLVWPARRATASPPHGETASSSRR
ncbi:MAG: 6-pyruvoyl-tetrahydropterin synthase-related protein [bacterium]